MNLPTSHNPDVICFSLARWDAPISSPAVSMAKEFSKSARVFFIEHPYSYKDSIRNRKTQGTYRDGDVVVVTPPSTYPINFLPEGKLYNFFAGLNNRIMVRALRKLIVGQKIHDFIFINFFDPFFLGSIPDDIAPAKYIYQCMDDITQVEYTRRHGSRLEEAIIKKADITLCTSRELTKLRKPLSGSVYFLPNAADTSMFNRAFRGEFERPADMYFDGRKIIGFTGSIEYRTDFGLLRELAEFHHDKIIVLIGPVYGDEHIRLGLSDMPNIVFAGARPISALPAYLQYVDCAIIPYKKNLLTRSIYPLKINEYLAAGKPVVATGFSEDIRSFHEVAYIAEDNKTFISAIDRAISEDSAEKKQQRVDAAAENSWEKRIGEFRSIISRR